MWGPNSKQPAAKQPVQMPVDVAVLDSDNDEGAADRQLVLEQSTAVERAWGLLPSRLLIGVGDQDKGLSARQHYDAKVRNRPSFLAMQPPFPLV